MGVNMEKTRIHSLKSCFTKVGKYTLSLQDLRSCLNIAPLPTVGVNVIELKDQISDLQNNLNNSYDSSQLQIK